jgi:hypothetical protein
LQLSGGASVDCVVTLGKEKGMDLKDFYITVLAKGTGIL